MNALFFLLPLSLVLLGASICAFCWSIRNGQFDDLERHGLDVLDDAPTQTDPPINLKPPGSTS